MMRNAGFLTLATLVLLFIAPSASALDKQDKQRDKIEAMRQETLAKLYAEVPHAEDEIEEAEGYAVFSNVGVQVFLLGGGGGSGVAIDQRTGNHTYMKMAQAKVGLGLGVKDFRAIFIFHDREPFTNFVEKGWDFSGEADAAAKVDDMGGDESEGASVRRGVSMYQFTEDGLALSASLNGTKYWKWKKLNK